MSYYRQQLESYLATLDIKADLVLDIGGAQGIVSNRVKSWDVKDYRVLDLPEFDIQKNISDDEADVIFCLEVFEYLIHPALALKNISTSLKTGGKAIVSFAFIYPFHQEVQADSLRYTLTGIQRMADLAGLEIAKTTNRVDRSGLLQQFYSADGMHPAKGYDHSITGYIIEFIKE